MVIRWYYGNPITALNDQVVKETPNIHTKKTGGEVIFGKFGRICAVSEARSSVRRPARGGREPTPCLGGYGSEPPPAQGGPGDEEQAGLLTADLVKLSGAGFHTLSILA